MNPVPVKMIHSSVLWEGTINCNNIRSLLKLI